MKRVLNVMLAAVIVISCMSFPSMSRAEETNTQMETDRRYDVLQHLGLYEGNHSATSGISRMEVVRSLVTIVNKDGNAYAYGYNEAAMHITDISESDKNDLGVAIRKKFVRNPADGMFYPNENADYDFVAYALVAMTGYTFELDTNQYKVRAAQLGLSDNLGSAAVGNFSAADYVNMLYNMLDAEYMIVQYGSESYHTTASDTVLEGMFGIGTAQWRLVANAYTDLTGKNSAAHNTLVFRDKTGQLYTDFECDYTYDPNLIGRQLTVFYDIEDEKILYMQPQRADDCLLALSGSDLIGFDRNRRKLSYQLMTSGDRWNQKFVTKEIALPTEMDIILNGQFTFEHKYVYDLLEGKGSLNIASVHLYDIDGDSKSDLMNIDAYQDYLVKSTSTTDDNLSILDSVSNTRITIENGNKDIVSIENEKGESIRFNNIKSDDIVSVFQGLGSVNYTKIVVSSRVETQYLKETYREFGKQYIATDEDVYSLSQGIKAENPEISLGRAYKLYIDAFGVVADYRVSDSIYDSIAAVVQFSMKKGMDHTLSAKLFTATGNFVNYDFANEYYIDGLPAIFNGETWMYNSKEVTETLKKEVFQFELNGKGEIRNVYLPSGEKQDGKISHTLGMLNVENILNDPNNYTMIYKRNGKHFIPYGSGTSYMNFIVLNAHAKVITIPSTTVVKNREAYFRVQEGELSNDYRAAAIGYSFSPDSTVSDLVVMISDGSSDLSSSSYYVVSDVYTCLNKEGAVVKGLSLMKNDGSVTEFYGEDEEIMECHPESGEKIRDNAEINVGDVIKIALNAAGEINAVGKFYDCNAGKGSMNNVTYWYTGNRFVYGCVYDIDTRSLAYVTGTSITPSMNFQTSLNLQGLLSAKAVMIKPGRNAEKIVEYGTIGEVVSYKENPELYSKMVLAGGYGEQSLLAFYLHE